MTQQQPDSNDDSFAAALRAAGHDLGSDVCPKCWENAQALAARDPSRSAQDYYAELTIAAEGEAEAVVAGS